MIRKVAIRNFKSLRDVLIDLERFTVFVGPNASGKSSILQALNYLCWAFNQMNWVSGLDRHEFESELAQARSRGSEDPVELASESDRKWYRYRTGGGPLQPHLHVRAGKWDGRLLGVPD